MTDKIIAAAREAGFSAENGRIFANCESSPAHVLCTNAASALYAIAYRQGLEDAAKVCDEEHKRARYNMDVDLSGNQQFWNGAAIFADQLGEAIRALKEQDAAIAAGKGEAS